MGGRRTIPLILLVLLGGALVIARLWQIQIEEHAIWADEARKLVRSGQLLPYKRGAIRDGSGAALVLDQTVYHVELVYRDFRRGHPLGQIAHGRSALIGRGTSLYEARVRLLEWGGELIRLSPGELYEFARGGPLQVGELAFSRSRAPFEERRAIRASDLRFYAKSLFDLTELERRRLVKLERSDSGRSSYLELVAAMRGEDPQELAFALEDDWLRSMDHLESLADRLDWEAEEDNYGALPPVHRLVAELEAWRISVEDAAASRLFREVSGFHPGRIESGLMLSRIELGFLARQFAWEPARLEAWARQARYGWLRSWREGYAVPRLLAEAGLAGKESIDADLVLAFLCSVFGSESDFVRALDGEPRPWREIEELAVFSSLEGLFRDVREGESVAELRRAPLPTLEPGLREAASGRQASFELLVELTDPAQLVRVREELAERLGSRFESTYESSLKRVWERDIRSASAPRRERVTLLALALLDTFEHSFQARLAEWLMAAGGGRPSSPPLVFAEDRLERLGERARHLLKDFGSRRAVLFDEPSDEVVYLLTRWRDRYPGLTVERGRERVIPVQPGQRAPLALELLGQVSVIDADLAQRQREQSAELRQLRGLIERSPEQEQRLKSLMQEVLLEGERRGVSGIEAYLDRRLRGSNGYRERLGLEDVFGEGARSIFLSRVVDGEDAWLTLDPALQRAAAKVINEPVFDPRDSKIDLDWLEAPVGAIVLCTPDGRLLAAASSPDSGADLSEDAEGERGRVVDRTLAKPMFQPVGSVFKPFVAAHLLETLPKTVYSTTFEHSCEVPPGGRWAEHEGVRCHSRYGHGWVDLERALHVSCNAYFARLADLIEFGDLEAICTNFGFGKPTGVRSLGDGPGLEKWTGPILEFDPNANWEIQMRRGTNGLQVVEGTPAQVARAMCGLATGVLPELRLIDRVGQEQLPPQIAQRLPYSEQNLDIVRKAMWGVCNDREGSAYDVLSVSDLGFAMAAKTGSADLESRQNADGESVVSKHTWLAGWAPAEDPQIVFCMFVYDTIATSSHSSVYVAQQLFRDPDVRAFLEARGVPLAALPGGER